MSASKGPLGDRSVNLPPAAATPSDSKKRKSDGNHIAIDPDDVELDPYFASVSGTISFSFARPGGPLPS